MCSTRTGYSNTGSHYAPSAASRRWSSPGCANGIPRISILTGCVRAARWVLYQVAHCCHAFAAAQTFCVCCETGGAQLLIGGPVGGGNPAPAPPTGALLGPDTP